MTSFRPLIVACALALAVLLGACSNYRGSGGDQGNWEYRLEKQAQMAADRMRGEDPSLNRFFDSAVGYALFPKVTKAAVGVGGAHGEGVVFQGSQAIGYATLSQASLGVSLGGQTYSEVVFFETQSDLDVFKQSNMHFSAEASAVAVARGAGAKADYSNGVAVFTADQEGLMFEASIGGQKFSYMPK